MNMAVNRVIQIGIATGPCVFRVWLLADQEIGQKRMRGPSHLELMRNIEVVGDLVGSGRIGRGENIPLHRLNEKHEHVQGDEPVSAYRDNVRAFNVT